MAWRAVMVQQAAHLSLRGGQIAIRSEKGEFLTPAEDVAALVLESPQITLTSALLAALSEHGCAVLTCGRDHMPSGVLLPFHAHSRQSEIAKLQQTWSTPLRKRLWQKVVRAKIGAQADLLERHATPEDARHMRAYAGAVTSGDPENREAAAARYYWPRLCGPEFRRGADDGMNAALNYGYAVLRSYVARALAAQGLLPTFGLHHDNALNAFNLADDVMEPFRPLVDSLVIQLHKEGELTLPQLSKTARQRLAFIGHVPCRMGQETHTVMQACSLTAEGLVTAIREKDPAAFILPSMPEIGAECSEDEEGA